MRAVLLTGAGRGFCAGADLGDRDPRKERPDLAAIIERLYNPTLRLIRSLDKPVVCAVNGVAAGAGANIALACDIVLAARSAKFIQAFAKIGLIPDAGGSWSLARILGEPRAKALALLAEPLEAETAAAWGHDLEGGRRRRAHGRGEGDRRAPRRRADARARADQAGDPGGGGERASTRSSTSSATCRARPGAPTTMPRASSPSWRSASRSSQANDHRDHPFPAGAGRGLRRGDVGDRLGLAAARACGSTTSAPGEATVSMDVADFMLNGHGSAHGGFIFSVADSAFAFACNTYNQRAVAYQVSITYMAPGRAGDRLTAAAREVYRAGRNGIYDVHVTNDRGEPVAEFRGHSRTVKGTHLPE